MPLTQFVYEVYLFNPRMVYRRILGQRGHVPMHQTMVIRSVGDVWHLHELC